jgi:hypothetical protein
MKNLVEVRTPTVDRFGEPAVEVRYVYKEPDINKYMSARGGKAYSDDAYDKLLTIKAVLALTLVVVILIPFEFIKAFFDKKP